MSTNTFGGLTKRGVSPQRRQLIEIMQAKNFGRFERLPIRGGDPVLNPPPRLIREIKPGGENGARPERAAADFLLKTQVVETFQVFDQIGDGVIEILEFKNGLPFRLLVADATA